MSLQVHILPDRAAHGKSTQFSHNVPGRLSQGTHRLALQRLQWPCQTIHREGLTSRPFDGRVLLQQTTEIGGRLELPLSPLEQVRVKLKIGKVPSERSRERELGEACGERGVLVVPQASSSRPIERNSLSSAM